MLQKLSVEKSGVEKFMVEISWIEKIMVEKSGVEKSRVGKFMVEKSSIYRRWHLLLCQKVGGNCPPAPPPVTPMHAF